MYNANIIVLRLKRFLLEEIMGKSKRSMVALCCAIVLSLCSCVGACALFAAKAIGEGAPQKGQELPINFPALESFGEIDANLQSCDPGVYNFQMQAKRNGLFFYFVQNLPVVVASNPDNWQNTHVEMEIWQGDFGYGWSGTYVALFLDGTIYFNNTKNVARTILRSLRSRPRTGTRSNTTSGSSLTTTPQAVMHRMRT